MNKSTFPIFRLIFVSFIIGPVFSGCDVKQPDLYPDYPTPSPAVTGSVKSGSLAEARKGFQTKLTRSIFEREPIDQPTDGVFRVVHYESPVGSLPAYLTADPDDGKKHPAIIWITGGDCNSIGDVWHPAPPENDQTARAYREAGIVMLFPSLRGGNENPGMREGCLREVDDVIAAADFLAGQSFVDPERIYLGGHSTGGTLALLTAEISPRFRAVFSFGPVADYRGYGANFACFDPTNDREFELRSPLFWLDGIKSPVFVFEGDRRGNVDSLQMMAKATKNLNIRFYPVRRADHFDVLAPVNNIIAPKILADTAPACNISFTQEELNRVMR